MRRTPRAAVLFAVVLGLFAAATAAYAALQKTVTVVVDGAPQQVHTFAGSVGGALSDGGIHLGLHDTVAPDLAAPVHDGSRVYIGRGRQLALLLNGRERTIWVTARNVDQVLLALGLRVSGEYLSASRSAAIPISGYALTVRLPQRVTVLVDGRRLVVSTTAPSVSALLAQLHIRLARTDRVNVPAVYYPTDGLVVTVTRYRARTLTEAVAIPYQVVNRADSAMFQGETQVQTPGSPGEELLVYRVQLRNGRSISQQLISRRLVIRPQTEVVLYGTKAPQASSLNWTALAYCESSDNPRAVSPGGTYRGLYQFSFSSWYLVGGSGDPIDASPAEQTYRAELLYGREGSGAWPVCGHYLYT